MSHQQHPNPPFQGNQSNRNDMASLLFLRFSFDVPKDSERYGIAGVREFVVVCFGDYRWQKQVPLSITVEWLFGNFTTTVLSVALAPPPKPTTP